MFLLPLIIPSSVAASSPDPVACAPLPHRPALLLLPLLPPSLQLLLPCLTRPSLIWLAFSFAMAKRPRDDEPQQQHIGEEGAVAGFDDDDNNDDLAQQQQQQQQSGAYVAEFAAAGAQPTPDLMLLPAHLSTSGTTYPLPASTTPRVSKKVKLEPSVAAANAQLAALAAVAAPTNSNTLPPVSPAAVKRSSEIVRNEYIKKMETFWQDQLAETQSQSREQATEEQPLSNAVECERRVG